MPPKASSSKPRKTNASTPKLALSETPLPLKAFLDALVAYSGLTLAEAVGVAGPLLKAGHSSTQALSQLSESKLLGLGIQDGAVVRKLLHFGHRRGGRAGAAAITNDAASAFSSSSVLYASSSSASTKRKWDFRDRDLDHPLPDAAPNNTVGRSLDFGEELDPEALETKLVITNRAPIMTAWATVVAERLGFSREESLSVAQAYTEMNATSRGVSSGILKAPTAKDAPGSSQPHVDLMGRQVPVMALQSGQWRGLVKAAISEPDAAFSYIHRSLHQQMGGVLGAMRLLAESFEPRELNEKGYGLYISFRPPGTGWGEKSEMALCNILSLRRFLTHKDPKDEVASSTNGTMATVKEADDEAPAAKKLQMDPDADPYDDLLNDDFDFGVAAEVIQAS